MAGFFDFLGQLANTAIDQAAQSQAPRAPGQVRPSTTQVRPGSGFARPSSSVAKPNCCTR
jgi:hypothetical protein